MPNIMAVITWKVKLDNNRFIIGKTSIANKLVFMAAVSDYSHSRPKLKTSDSGSEFRFCLNSNFGNVLNF